MAAQRRSPGPCSDFALIFANLSLIGINLLGSVVFALLLPYVALGRTLLYFDLAACAAEAPTVAERRRRWLPRRHPKQEPGLPSSA